MENLISIIVPVYNTPLEMFTKCVDSLVSQSYQNIEVILIDDGSNSGIESICDEYADRYPNFSVIHKKNGGLSSARNAGFKKCTGKWVMFLDSDDWLDENTCDELSKITLRFSEADFFVFGFRHDYGKRVEDCKFTFENESVFGDGERNNLFLEALKFPSLFSSSCWKLYSNKFLHDASLDHDEQIRQGSEDLEFMLRVIANYKKSVYIAKRYYNYVMNKDSITNSFNEDNAYKVLRCFEKMEEVILRQKKCIRDSFYIRAWFAICASLISGFMNPNNSLSYKEKKEKSQKYVKDSYCTKVMREITLSSVGLSRGIVLFCVKNNLWILIYIIAVIRGKQKNRL